MPLLGGSVFVKYTADISDLKKGTKEAEKEVKDFGSSANESSEKAGKAFKSAGDGASSMSSNIKKAGVAVAGFLAAAAGYQALKSLVSTIKEVGTEAINLAGIQEESETKLAAVLRSTGEAAGFNIDQLTEMAGAMQGLTTVGDEVTLNGMAILSTFKEIKGDAFQGATQAALDMSQVMGTDLNSSMVMLGKALNDPTVGLTALTRVGVSFTEQQKEQIKALQASGDMMGAQKLILAELNSEFGGAAAAARETFSGGVTAAQNALGDLKEEIGFVITKNQFFIDLVALAEDYFVEWGAAIKENREYLMELAKDGIMKVFDAINIVLETMRFFENGWLGIKLAAQVTLQALAEGLAVVMDGINMLLSPLSAIWDGLVAIGAVEANPFPGLGESIYQFRDATRVVTDDILTDIQETNDKYDSWKESIAGVRAKVEEIPVSQATATDAVVAGTAAMSEAYDTLGESVIESTETMTVTASSTFANGLEGPIMVSIGNITNEYDQLGWTITKTTEQTGADSVSAWQEGLEDPLIESMSDIQGAWEDATIGMGSTFSDMVDDSIAKWSEFNEMASGDTIETSLDYNYNTGQWENNGGIKAPEGWYWEDGKWRKDSDGASSIQNDEETEATIDREREERLAEIRRIRKEKEPKFPSMSEYVKLYGTGTYHNLNEQWKIDHPDEWALLQKEYARRKGYDEVPASWNNYNGYKYDSINNINGDGTTNGAGGVVNVTISPTFMTGDKSSIENAARAMHSELKKLNLRWA